MLGGKQQNWPLSDITHAQTRMMAIRLGQWNVLAVRSRHLRRLSLLLMFSSSRFSTCPQTGFSPLQRPSLTQNPSEKDRFAWHAWFLSLVSSKSKKPRWKFRLLQLLLHNLVQRSTLISFLKHLFRRQIASLLDQPFKSAEESSALAFLLTFHLWTNNEPSKEIHLLHLRIHSESKIDLFIWKKSYTTMTTLLKPKTCETPLDRSVPDRQRCNLLLACVCIAIVRDHLLMKEKEKRNKKWRRDESDKSKISYHNFLLYLIFDCFCHVCFNPPPSLHWVSLHWAVRSAQPAIAGSPCALWKASFHGSKPYLISFLWGWFPFYSHLGIHKDTRVLTHTHVAKVLDSTMNNGTARVAVWIQAASSSQEIWN